MTDLATVQGTGTANPPTPTGSVTFHLCGPTATDSTALCTTGGTLVSTNALAGSSPPAGEAQATSDAVNTGANPLLPGRYCFRADWPGDTNYTDALTHTGTGNSECFVVRTIDTTTVTTPRDSSGPISGTVALGSSIFDRAVVTGAGAGGSPTGTVSFTVCNPNQIDDPSPTDNANTCDVGGTAAGTNIALTPGANNTSSADSSSVTVNIAGTWCFRAQYTHSGNTYNDSSDSSVTECVTVGKIATGTVTTGVGSDSLLTGLVLDSRAAALGVGPTDDEVQAEIDRRRLNATRLQLSLILASPEIEGRQEAHRPAVGRCQGGDRIHQGRARRRRRLRVAGRAAQRRSVQGPEGPAGLGRAHRWAVRRLLQGGGQSGSRRGDRPDQE